MYTPKINLHESKRKWTSKLTIQTIKSTINMRKSGERVQSENRLVSLFERRVSVPSPVEAAAAAAAFEAERF